ncbi:MAG: hypothetical protein RIR96_437 [Bacteroidota bacterium]|jgi:hypothetical protein
MFNWFPSFQDNVENNFKPQTSNNKQQISNPKSSMFNRFPSFQINVENNLNHKHQTPNIKPQISNV